jgi:hypothetical protein
MKDSAFNAATQILPDLSCWTNGISTQHFMQCVQRSLFQYGVKDIGICGTEYLNVWNNVNMRKERKNETF